MCKENSIDVRKKIRAELRNNYLNKNFKNGNFHLTLTKVSDKWNIISEYMNGIVYEHTLPLLEVKDYIHQKNNIYKYLNTKFHNINYDESCINKSIEFKNQLTSYNFIKNEIINDILKYFPIDLRDNVTIEVLINSIQIYFKSSLVFTITYSEHSNKIYTEILTNTTLNNYDSYILLEVYTKIGNGIFNKMKNPLKISVINLFECKDQLHKFNNVKFDDYIDTSTLYDLKTFIVNKDYTFEIQLSTYDTHKRYLKITRISSHKYEFKVFSIDHDNNTFTEHIEMLSKVRSNLNEKMKYIEKLINTLY